MTWAGPVGTRPRICARIQEKRSPPGGGPPGAPGALPAAPGASPSEAQESAELRGGEGTDNISFHLGGLNFFF